VAAPGRCNVRVLGIGRQIVDIAVAAGTEQHRLTGVAFKLTGNQIADHYAPSLALYHHQVQHFSPGIYLQATGLHHPHHGAVGSQQELLPGLPLGVEGTSHLGPAKGPIIQQTAVLPGKGYPLGHTVVNNGVANFRQSMDIGLPGAVVSPLEGVVEQPPDAIAIVGIVLAGVNSPWAAMLWARRGES
jgi:hypothetical protein